MCVSTLRNYTQTQRIILGKVQRTARFRTNSANQLKVHQLVGVFNCTMNCKLTPREAAMIPPQL